MCWMYEPQTAARVVRASWLQEGGVQPWDPATLWWVFAREAWSSLGEVLQRVLTSLRASSNVLLEVSPAQ